MRTTAFVMPALTMSKKVIPERIVRTPAMIAHFTIGLLMMSVAILDVLQFYPHNGAY